MRFKNKVLINRFSKFISSITPKDRVAVIHHTDPDGVCSGVIISKVVERLRSKKIDLRINQYHAAHRILDETITQLKKKKINKVITTDLATDEDPANIRKLAKFADILIIDHHPVLHKFPLKNVIVIKSKLISNKSPYCASKMCYDLGSLVADVSDLDWLAVVGSIGDIATGPWKRWVSSVFKKYKVKMKKNLFDTKFGEISKILSSAETFSHKNVKECFTVLYSAKSYKSVLKSRLNRFKKKIDAELDYYIKNLKKLAYIDGDLIYYEIKPKYNIKSPLSTILGLKYPSKTVFIVDITKNPARISARSQKVKVKVNKILISSMKGIKDAYGGGHAVSSGAVIPKKDYKKFKERLFKSLQKKEVKK